MRYRLRTLLIVLALGPPVLWIGWQLWAISPDAAAGAFLILACATALFIAGFVFPAAGNN